MWRAKYAINLSLCRKRDRSYCSCCGVISSFNDLFAREGGKEAVLDVLERVVARKRLGKLLSGVWTEVVPPKTAKRTKQAQNSCISAKIQNLFCLILKPIKILHQLILEREPEA